MKKLYTMPKDHDNVLNRLVDIMTFVEEHDETATAEEIKKRYDGEHGFILFSRYCLGDKEAYAQHYGPGYKLTQLGIRKLVELRGIQATQSRAFWMMIASILMAVFIFGQLLYQMGLLRLFMI